MALHRPEMFAALGVSLLSVVSTEALPLLSDSFFPYSLERATRFPWLETFPSAHALNPTDALFGFFEKPLLNLCGLRYSCKCEVLEYLRRRRGHVYQQAVL